MEPAAKDDNTDVSDQPFEPTAPPETHAADLPDTEQDAGSYDQNQEPWLPPGAPPLADNPPYYNGLWNGYPIFKCPYCSYTALESHGGPGAIELHILNQIDRGNKGHEPALALKED